MNRKSSLLLACALSLVLGACSDDESGPQVVDAGASPVAPDAGAPVVGQAIPLILWVDDLLDHHTTDESVPDTVHDKNISDDEDPAVFEKRFPR